MQLVAYGAQDFYLTGNPQITFFKVVYRRHTNFATESIEQTFNGSATFSGKAVCNIQRSGDLITKMYLRTVLSGPSVTGERTGKWAWVSRVGHALINDIVLEIGGTQIDKHYSDWLNIWQELARNFAQDRGYNIMIGNTPEQTTLASSHKNVTLWIPVQFACCRNDGLALPVIALQYHDIKVTFDFNPVSQLINRTSNFTIQSGDFQMNSTSLFVDYVYLDNEERKRFAQASHEYLFEQLQFSGAESFTNTNNKVRLNLNHPCKELVWVTKANRYNSGNPYLFYDPSSPDHGLAEATKRFILRLANYTITPASGGTPASAVLAAPTNGYISMADNVPPELAAIFTACRAIALNVNSTAVDNVIILGDLIPLNIFSTTTTKLFANLTLEADTNVVTVEGGKNLDVCVYQHDNYGIHLNGSSNPTQQALLQLNSHDRLSQREGQYYNYVQPWQCHTNTPTDGVNVISFALNPEEHQPSGTCNFSRIDNATLQLTIDSTIATDSSVSVFATNYNVLRVMSGMGGLAYSN